ncbi:MAG: arsenical pump-driving ATPase [Acidimicrobiales bacterium]|nr:arsenical pump-driving ATPase [Acidimicrobiales bacterium]
MLDALLSDPTRFLFFTGKGGVGKTSLSSAAAVALARQGRRVLLVSTDPASNLSEVLDTSIGSTPRPVNGVPGLDALDIDPDAAASAYRDRVVGPYRGVLPDVVVANIEEQLSGACTVEIAAFDEFTALLADPGATAGYDHVVFDTAPTGHTLRLLALPGAWTGFLDTNTAGVTCIGPMSGLTQAHDRYRVALDFLADPSATTLVLVTRPEGASLEEADRARHELAEIGIGNQHLVVNGAFAPGDPGDATARALADRQAAAMADVPPGLASLARDTLPLLAVPPIGADALASMLDGRSAPSPGEATGFDAPTTSLLQIADRVAERGRGLVMTMGKGGVGKTTVAAALAVELARRGLPVTLSTTDPAAHLTGALAGGTALPDNLVVERIDPDAATAAYTAEVLADAGAGLDAGGVAVLEEDLRSPCTAEIAVFRTFAATVGHASDRIVVLDTAPTGHTLLLLDAAQSYQREVERHQDTTSDDVAQLLARLRDPDYTTLLLVTLPEPTPVHEAAELQADLERADIRPAAWVANQTLTATGTTDPILAERARHEQRWLVDILERHDQLAVVPWQVTAPTGADALAALVTGGAPLVTAGASSVSR